jgi:hypothetical protein
MKKPLAVFTIAQFEPVFFPKWLEHYQRWAPGADLHVLHHAAPPECTWELTTGTTSLSYADWLTQLQAFVTLSPQHTLQTLQPHVAFDHTWLRQTVEAYQTELLTQYDWVLFTEIDELVVSRCRLTLDAVVATQALQRPLCIQLQGFELVHRTDDATLDWQQPLLPQRPLGYYSQLYSKPLLASQPVQYELGFHRALNVAPLFDPTLWLFHLHKADYATTWNRLEQIRQRAHHQPDRDLGRGWQNHISDRAQLTRFLLTHSDHTDIAQLCAVPAEFLNPPVF